MPTLTTIIAADASSFNRAIDDVTARSEKLARTMRAVGARLTAGVTLPIVAFGATAVKSGAAFEASMNRVGAITGAVGQDFKALEDQAKQLGIETQFSASEAAAGMTFLGQAGFSTTQILAAMPGTLQLAAAGNLDLASAADIASNVLTGFGLEAAELGRVNDVLAKTFTSTNTDLQQLAEGMKFVAPVAAGLGVSVEETSAAIGLLSNAGLQASTAGTGLRRILSVLAQDADKLGVSVTDSTGAMLPLADILDQLEKRGFSTAEALEIFGDRGGPALQALLSQGSGALRDLEADLLNAGGTAQRIADRQMEGLSGALKGLRSAIEGVQIAVFDSGLGAFLERITRGATEAIRAFAGLPAPLLQVSVGIAGVAAAAGPLLFLLGQFPSVLKVASVGLGVFRTALLSLGTIASGPIGIIALAVGALFLAFKTNFLGIGDVVRKAMTFITERFATFRTAAKLVTDNMGTIQFAISAAMSSISLILHGFALILHAWLVEPWERAAESIGKSVGATVRFVGEGINAMRDFYAPFVDWMRNLGISVGRLFGRLGEDALEGVNNLVNNTMSGLVDTAEAIVSESENATRGVAEIAQGIHELNNIWDIVSSNLNASAMETTRAVQATVDAAADLPAALNDGAASVADLGNAAATSAGEVSTLTKRLNELRAATTSAPVGGAPQRIRVPQYLADEAALLIAMDTLRAVGPTPEVLGTLRRLGVPIMGGGGATKQTPGPASSAAVEGFAAYEKAASMAAISADKLAMASANVADHFLVQVGATGATVEANREWEESLRLAEREARWAMEATQASIAAHVEYENSATKAAIAADQFRIANTGLGDSLLTMVGNTAEGEKVNRDYAESLRQAEREARWAMEATQASIAAHVEYQASITDSAIGDANAAASKALIANALERVTDGFSTARDAAGSFVDRVKDSALASQVWARLQNIATLRTLAQTEAVREQAETMAASADLLVSKFGGSNGLEFTLQAVTRGATSMKEAWIALQKAGITPTGEMLDWVEKRFQKTNTAVMDGIRIAGGFAEALSELPGVAGRAFGTLSDLATDTMNVINAFSKGLINGIMSLVGTAIKWIVRLFERTKSKAQEAAEAAAKNALDIGTSLAQGAASSVASVLSAAFGQQNIDLIDFQNNIRNALSDAVRSAVANAIAQTVVFARIQPWLTELQARIAQFGVGSEEVQSAIRAIGTITREATQELTDILPIFNDAFLREGLGSIERPALPDLAGLPEDAFRPLPAMPAEHGTGITPFTGPMMNSASLPRGGDGQQRLMIYLDGRVLTDAIINRMPGVVRITGGVN